MSIESHEDRETLPQLDLERRQDDVLVQLDELNERIENLIELYTRLRAADQTATNSGQGTGQGTGEGDQDEFEIDQESSSATPCAA